MKVLSVVLVLLSLVAVVPASASGVGGEGADKRKVIKRVVPHYPEIARNLHLSGTVRLEAQVSANGDLKDLQVKGGSPVLVQSAKDAVREWKWEKGDRETTEQIEIDFNP
jgi:TonB family protein